MQKYGDAFSKASSIFIPPTRAEDGKDGIILYVDLFAPTCHAPVYILT